MTTMNSHKYISIFIISAIFVAVLLIVPNGAHAQYNDYGYNNGYSGNYGSYGGNYGGNYYNGNCCNNYSYRPYQYQITYDHVQPVVYYSYPSYTYSYPTYTYSNYGYGYSQPNYYQNGYQNRGYYYGGRY